MHTLGSGGGIDLEKMRRGGWLSPFTMWDSTQVIRVNKRIHPLSHHLGPTTKLRCVSFPKKLPCVPIPIPSS